MYAITIDEIMKLIKSGKLKEYSEEKQQELLNEYSEISSENPVVYTHVNDLIVAKPHPEIANILTYDSHLSATYGVEKWLDEAGYKVLKEGSSQRDVTYISGEPYVGITSKIETI